MFQTFAIAAFGAFVDVGVHQDGLIHISQLSDRFVENPHDVVKPGEKIKVRVMEVDLQRRRVALTAKSGDLAVLLATRVGSGGPTAASGNEVAGRPQARTNGARGNGRSGGARPERGGNNRGGGGGRSEGDLKHNPFAALLQKR